MADFAFDENVAEQTGYVLADLGHDVLTTRQARTKGLDDARQLWLAARFGRIFVTYNRNDFLLLHRAWRLWSHEWNVSGQIRHPGILILPSPPRLAADRGARLLDQLIRDQGDTANRLFIWSAARNWWTSG